MVPATLGSAAQNHMKEKSKRKTPQSVYVYVYMCVSVCVVCLCDLMQWNQWLPMSTTTSTIQNSAQCS